MPRLCTASARAGGDGRDERRALPLGGADALVDPGLAEGLLRRRQRDAGGGGRASRVVPQGGDLGRERAVAGEEPVEAGEVARPARLGEAGEAAERRGRHAPRPSARARAARRMRSEKRMAAATAR